MKKVMLLYVAVVFAACNSSVPVNTGRELTAADLKTDAVNPVISGIPAKKDSSELKKDTIAAVIKSEPVKGNDQALISNGQALINKNDCIGCHNAEVKMAGPAYRDIAKKYESTAENIDKLVNKVISGGSGNWGTIDMLPHPTISKNDIKAMVTYVLSLR